MLYTVNVRADEVAMGRKTVEQMSFVWCFVLRIVFLVFFCIQINFSLLATGLKCTLINMDKMFSSALC